MPIKPNPGDRFYESVDAQAKKRGLALEIVDELVDGHPASTVVASFRGRTIPALEVIEQMRAAEISAARRHLVLRLIYKQNLNLLRSAKPVDFARP